MFGWLHLKQDAYRKKDKPLTSDMSIPIIIFLTASSSADTSPSISRHWRIFIEGKAHEHGNDNGKIQYIQHE